jgi:hypothetical protein
MNVSTALDGIEAAFERNDPNAAQTLLAELIGAASVEPIAVRTEVVVAIADRLERLHPQVAAHLALGAGALVESGVSAALLGRAIVDPLERVLEHATRFVERVHDLEDADGQATIEIGRRSIARADIDAIADDDYPCVASFFSLATWYRPAVAAFSRDRDSLREMKKRPRYREALAALGDSSEGTFWLSILIEATIDEPFVLLFPELGEAYEVVLDGVVDCGQLTVLASAALEDPLGRIGASPPASEEAIAVMRGDGPQQDPNAAYSSTFHLYPWNAIDPETGLPEDGRVTWSAPGGTGSHSLPPDFLPATIEPIDGRRALVVVGPGARGGMRFVRVIAATRMFSALPASIASAKRLGAEEAKRFYAAVHAAIADG